MISNLIKYIGLLLVSIVIVIGFTWVFSQFYSKSNPSYELKDYHVNIEILNKDGTTFKPDSCTYTIIPSPQIINNPTDEKDYSSYLISFISVLATFVVVANFANATDLLKSVDSAETAKEEAETAKEEAETAKKEAEKTYNDIKSTLNRITETEEQAKTKLTEVEQAKKTFDTTIKEQSKDIERIKKAIDDILPIIERIKANIKRNEIIEKNTSNYGNMVNNLLDDTSFFDANSEFVQTPTEHVVAEIKNDKIEGTNTEINNI